MTEEQEFALLGMLIIVVIGLFIFSAKQKRQHEEKMKKLRAERKANLEKLKREQANK